MLGLVNFIKGSIAQESLGFLEDQNLPYSDYCMKNKAQNGVCNLKQLVANVFPTPEAGETVSPQAAKMQLMFS